MKIIKTLVFIILGLVLLFFVIGLVMPTVNYGHEITVNKSIQEAWAVTEDDSKYALWLDGFKSEELISGEKGVVGCQYKVIVNPGEGEGDFEMVSTLVARKDDEYIDLHFDSDMMDFDQRMLFAQKDGKTMVKTESTVKGSTLIMRSMFAIMELFSGSFQKQEEYNMNNLKKVIDENTTDYFKEDNLKEDVSPE